MTTLIRQSRQSRQAVPITVGRRRPRLDWTQGRVIEHVILGRRRHWRSKCRRFEITRMLELGGGPFTAVDRAAFTAGEALGNFRTLAAAKRACEVRR